MANTTTMKKAILIAEPQATIINTTTLTAVKRDINIPMNITTNMDIPIVMPTVMTMTMAVNIATKPPMSMNTAINMLIPIHINMNMPTVMKVRDMPMATNILTAMLIPTAMNTPILTGMARVIAAIMVKMAPVVVTEQKSRIKMLKS